ncbi:hypothetical protein [Frigidibacter sp. SD6-1]|uniref:hypothetical protein n=1 Tax=Frigidibacter sp. SD6-1 TaxID=3032581 RepID=UPI0024E0284B|nr:hypothetical protein [Frigidibacter sp. SD6-1]
MIDSIRSKTALRQDPLEQLQYSGGVRILRFSRLAGEDRDYTVTPYGDRSVDQRLKENRDTIIGSRNQLRVSPIAMRALDREGFSLDQVITRETGGTALLAIVVDERDGASSQAEQQADRAVALPSSGALAGVRPA